MKKLYTFILSFCIWLIFLPVLLLIGAEKDIPLAPGTRIVDMSFGQNYSASVFISIFYKILPNTKIDKALDQLQKNLQSLVGDITICYDRSSDALYLITLQDDIGMVVFRIYPEKGLGKEQSPDSFFNRQQTIALDDEKDYIFKELPGYVVKKYLMTDAVKQKVYEFVFEDKMPLELTEFVPLAQEDIIEVSEDIKIVRIKEAVQEIEGRYQIGINHVYSFQTGTFKVFYKRQDYFSHEILSWNMPDEINGEYSFVQYLGNGQVIALAEVVRYLPDNIEKRLENCLILFNLEKSKYKYFKFNSDQRVKTCVLPDGGILLLVDGQLVLVNMKEENVKDVVLTTAGVKIVNIGDIALNSDNQRQVVISGMNDINKGSDIIILEFNNEEGGVVVAYRMLDRVTRLYYCARSDILLRMGKNVALLKKTDGKIFTVLPRKALLFTGTEFCGALEKEQGLLALSIMRNGFLMQNYVFAPLERKSPKRSDLNKNQSADNQGNFLTGFGNNIPRYVRVSIFADALPSAKIGAAKLTEKGNIIIGIKESVAEFDQIILSGQILELNPEDYSFRIIPVADSAQGAVTAIAEDNGVIVAALTDGQQQRTLHLLDTDDSRIRQYYEREKSYVLAGVMKGTNVWKNIQFKLVESIINTLKPSIGDD